MIDHYNSSLDLRDVSIKMISQAECHSSDELKLIIRSIDFYMNRHFELGAEIEFELRVNLSTQDAELVFERKIEISKIMETTYELPLVEFELVSESVEDESTLSEEIDRLEIEGLIVTFKFESK